MTLGNYMINYPTRQRGYFLKIAILALATIIGEFVIWWAMVRQESIDWISAQVVHQPSPYAVSQLDDGRLLVANVIHGYEIILPAGFELGGGRNPTYDLMEQEQLVCQIVSRITNNAQKDNAWRNVFAGDTAALVKEQTADSGLISQLIIPLDSAAVQLNLYAREGQAARCQRYFTQVKNSFIYSR